MQILNGIAISKVVIKNLKTYVDSLIEKKLRLPHIVAILIGNNPASETYVKSKVNICNKIGIKSSLVHKENISNEQELLDLVNMYSTSQDVDGILVQLPLPSMVDPFKVLHAIPPEKDIDGFHILNVGKLALGMQDGFISATPLGIKMLLMAYRISVESKHVVIIGRSNIVGRPLSSLMSLSDSVFGNATVTLCHSKTKNIQGITSQADVLISCIGKAKYVTADMVKENAIVVDVGINRIEVDKKQKLVGDVDFENVAPKVSYITPVPGGVGRMTIAALMYNSVLAYARREKTENSMLTLNTLLNTKEV